MCTNAFLTGSCKYGIPREDSDIDLCILTDDIALIEVIISLSEEGIEQEDSYYSGRFGRLTVIICVNELEFEAWRAGTEKLCLVKPCTREQAIRVMEEERQLRGC